MHALLNENFMMHTMALILTRIPKYKPLIKNYTIFQHFSSKIEPVYISSLRKERYSDLLTNYGFNPGQVSRILNSPYLISQVQEKIILSNMVNWLNFKVGDKLFSALSAYPELLTLNPEYVNQREKELLTLFTRADIRKLLVTCPNVFLDDFQDTYEKVQYIVSRMGVEQDSIVKCRALRFTFHHIKCRHYFLTYAGCFKLNKKSAKSKNAPLNKIFSNNMDTFLKLSKLTEEEYNVFSDCFSDEIDCFRTEDLDDILNEEE